MNAESIDLVFRQVFGNQMLPVRDEIGSLFPTNSEIPVYDSHKNIIWSIDLSPEFFWLELKDFKGYECIIDGTVRYLAELSFSKNGGTYTMWFYKDKCYCRQYENEFCNIFQTAVDYGIRTTISTKKGFINEKDIEARIGDFPYLLIRKDDGYEFISRTA